MNSKKQIERDHKAGISLIEAAALFTEPSIGDEFTAAKGTWTQSGSRTHKFPNLIFRSTPPIEAQERLLDATYLKAANAATKDLSQKLRDGTLLATGRREADMTTICEIVTESWALLTGIDLEKGTAVAPGKPATAHFDIRIRRFSANSENKISPVPSKVIAAKTEEAEAKCEAFMVKLMKENRNKPQKTKAYWRSYCVEHFGVSNRAFDRIWARAKKEAKAPAWGYSGPRARS